jgi:adenylate cyclase
LVKVLSAEAAVAVEIERKFLVRDLSMIEGVPGTPIRQGYLSLAPERTVRVRRAGDVGYLTVKGQPVAGPPGQPVSLSRPEFEYEIPAQEADELLDTLAVRPLIEKTRYRVAVSGLVWEIDVFAGENEGLVVAEVELPSENALLVLPDWAGSEVTADPRYLNVSLVERPYRTWPSG